MVDKKPRPAVATMRSRKRHIINNRREPLAPRLLGRMATGHHTPETADERLASFRGIAPKGLGANYFATMSLRLRSARTLTLL